MRPYSNRNLPDAPMAFLWKFTNFLRSLPLIQAILPFSAECVCLLLAAILNLYCASEGQPRKTENEFSHDCLTMIHRESDDSENPRFAIIFHFCDSDVEDLTFPVSLILEHRSTT